MKRAVGIAAVAVAFAVALASALAFRVYRVERTMCFPPPVRAPADPASFGLPAAREVVISAGHVEVRGLYVEGRNRAGVLLVHGAGGNRASLAGEARALAASGFGALLLELPGHGSSGGEIRWGAPERAAIRAAVTWLESQPSLEPERVGALGFSLGGYVLAQAAASDTRIRALALAATPSDLSERLALTHRRWGGLGAWAAERAFTQVGMDPASDTALESVRRIAPRSLLVVTGDRDPLVPEAMAAALFASAREPKELFVVSGAGHGDFSRVPGSDYDAKIVRFFADSLLAARAPD